MLECHKVLHADWTKGSISRLLIGRQGWLSNLTEKPDFVKAAPGDDLKTLYPVFYQHPDKFKPVPWEHGKCYNWGIVTEVDEMAGFAMAFMMRKMHTQMHYGHLPGFEKTPEHQFVARLIENKQKELSLKNRDILTRDFILRIEMEAITPKIWRQFKVAG